MVGDPLRLLAPEEPYPGAGGGTRSLRGVLTARKLLIIRYARFPQKGSNAGLEVHNQVHGPTAVYVYRLPVRTASAPKAFLYLGNVDHVSLADARDKARRAHSQEVLRSGKPARQFAQGVRPSCSAAREAAEGVVVHTLITSVSVFMSIETTQCRTRQSC